MTQQITLPGLPKSTGQVIRPNRCENCKYAEKSNPTHPVYECHKGPPTATIVPTNKGPQTLSTFPMVQATQWCGAFEKKIAMKDGGDFAEAQNAVHSAKAELYSQGR